MTRLLLASLFFVSFSLQAIELANPLTLGEALNLAKQQSLDEQQQALTIKLDQVEVQSYQDLYKPSASIDLQLARRDSENSGTNNSHAFLKVHQVLFDQNTSIKQATAEGDLSTSKLRLKALEDQKILQIMRAFFDVVLADMRYETILQRLAISAIREGRVRDDYEQQSASEVTLLEKQTQTQLDVSKRIEAESQQISTRAKLAQLLNVAYENRPDEIVKPNFKALVQQVPQEFEVWQEKVAKSNPKLNELSLELANLKQVLNQEKNNHEILVVSNARLGEQAYQREKNGNWRVGLNLTMPLGDSSTQKKKIAQLLLKIKQKQLSIEQLKHTLNQEALALFLKLKTLKQAHKALVTELDYRDLYLELARANYEMQIKSDIGYAMTNLTDTEWKLAKNEFDYVVTLTKLKQLAGENYAL